MGAMISVVIPTLNAEALLPHTFDCLIQATVRGLVREVSGAAPAERRKNAAIDAGYARRGYLRGVYETRRCKPALDAG